MPSNEMDAIPLLSWGIAQYAVRAEGLVAVYMPRQIRHSLANGVAQVANMLVNRFDVSDPYAIVVDPFKSADYVSTDSGNVLVVSVARAIRYRIGDRLVVVLGESADLESFRGVFRSVIGPEFPSGSTTPLEGVAREVAAKLVETARIDETVIDRITPHFALAMETLADVLRNSEDPRGNWTARWYQITENALEAIRNQVVSAMESDSEEDFESLVMGVCYGAFALPRPEGLRKGETPSYRQHQPGKAIQRAFKDFWNDTDTAEHSQSMLSEARRERGQVPLNMEFGGLDDEVTECGSIVEATQSTLLQDLNTLQAFDSISELEFMKPEPSDASFELVTVDGTSLELSAVQTAPGICVATSMWVPHSRSLAETETLRFRLRLPDSPEMDLSETEAHLRVSEANCHFEGVKNILANGIEFVGRVQFPLRREALREKKLTISLEVPTNDSLIGKIGSPSIKITVIPPVDRPCAVFFDVRAKGKLGAKAHYVGPTSRYTEATSDYPVLTNSAHRTFVIFQADRIEDQANIELHGVNGRSGLFAGIIDSGNSATITAEGQLFSFDSEVEGHSEISPLRAAALKCALSNDNIDTQCASDLRAIFEAYFSGREALGRSGDVFGHVVVSAEQIGGVSGAIRKQDGVLTLGCVKEDVPSLVNGQQFNRASLGQAGIAFDEAFGRIVDVLWEDEEHACWPSRLSLRHLWVDHRELVDGYLSSYERLLAVSSRNKSNSKAKLDWMTAAYPFSVSVWREGSCEGVYMSPLHPLRLAWLASTEATLYESNETENLIGTIEGWKFPFVGPAPKRRDVLISTPIDSGFEEVFAGWELLVPIVEDDTTELLVPQEVAGISAPGTSSSGLTASAVESAIREYLRINPQASSLSLDLASSTPSERISEIDDAVVKVLASSLVDDDMLLGITVQDSVMRTGEPPWEGLAELDTDGLDRRLTWLRYDPNSPKGLPAARIRVQPDSLLNIGSVEEQSDVDSAVIGPVPLRRFGAEYPSVENQDLVLHPLLDSKVSNRSAFEAALAAFEASIVGREIRITPREPTSQERNRIAEWTIAGESLISPNAIQEVLRSLTAGNGNRMLWEWRPPAFDDVGDSTELESRGYVTLSKIPDPLIAKVDKKLSQAIDQNVFDLKAEKVFQQLGARGIGLASLLTAGDKQASGAIGFFLALSLCDQLMTAGSVRVVLPIDSSQGFLDSLSGERQKRTKHRADLLMIDMRSDIVTFVPIEVKMYGLSAKEPYSTSGLNAVVNEATEQVGASRDLLKSLVKRRKSLTGSADKVLWDNALATLLETALKLATPNRLVHENDQQDLRTLFSRVVQGKATLRVADGLVFCFATELPGSKEWHTGQRTTAPNGSVVFRSTPADVIESMNGNTALIDACMETLDTQTRRHASEQQKDGAEKPAYYPTAADIQLPEEDEDSISERDVDAFDTPSNVLHVAKDEGTEVDSEQVKLNSDYADSSVPTDVTGEATLTTDSDKKPSNPVAVDETDSSVGVTPEERDSSIDLVRPGVRFDVGTYCNTVGRKKPELWLGNTALNQLNIGVVGDLGTGKTQLVKSLLAQIRYASAQCQSDPASMLVFDYKHDYCDSKFLDQVGGVVLEPYQIPLNLFALRPDELGNKQARERKIRAFVDVLQKIYSGIGQKQKNNLRSVIREGYDVFGAMPPTLQWIYEQYEEEFGSDSVAGMLDGFVNMEIFDDGSSETKSFDELLEGKVLVLNLNSLGTDQDLKNALVVLFLNLYYDWMKRLDKHPFLDGEPSIRYVSSYVVVDEATNIMEYDFPVLENILLEGREFGVGVLLSSQYLSHYKTKATNWAEPLLTWFIHKVPTITVADLKRAGLTVDQDVIDQIPQLPVHQALYKSLDSEPRIIVGLPFYKLKDRLPVSIQLRLNGEEDSM